VGTLSERWKEGGRTESGIYLRSSWEETKGKVNLSWGQSSGAKKGRRVEIHRQLKWRTWQLIKHKCVRMREESNVFPGF
jgi:hypothetical protein